VWGRFAALLGAEKRSSLVRRSNASAVAGGVSRFFAQNRSRFGRVGVRAAAFRKAYRRLCSTFRQFRQLRCRRLAKSSTLGRLWHNRAVNTEPQLQAAASPQGLRSGYRQR